MPRDRSYYLNIPECRKRPGQQARSQCDVQGAAVARLEANGYHVPRGDDGHPGQLITPTDFGGAVDRPRLFTIAVQSDIWTRCHAQFQWPDWNDVAPRPVRSILDPLVDEKYTCREGNAQRFQRLSHIPKYNRSLKLWRIND